MAQSPGTVPPLRVERWTRNHDSTLLEAHTCFLNHLGNQAHFGKWMKMDIYSDPSTSIHIHFGFVDFGGCGYGSIHIPSISITGLFRRTALTASYCTDLKVVLEAVFGEYTNARHQIKDASREVRYLAYQIASSRSITKHTRGRDSPFKPRDILQRGVDLLNGGVKRFNNTVVEGRWEEEEDVENVTTQSFHAYIYIHKVKYT